MDRLRDSLAALPESAGGAFSFELSDTIESAMSVVAGSTPNYEKAFGATYAVLYQRKLSEPWLVTDEQLESIRNEAHRLAKEYST